MAMYKITIPPPGAKSAIVSGNDALEALDKYDEYLLNESMGFTSSDFPKLDTWVITEISDDDVVMHDCLVIY